MNIDQKRIGNLDGFEIDARLVPDPDTDPRDYDCYDADQVAAFRLDCWQFVGVIVSASRAGVELGSSSLWAVEYGDMPGVDDFVNPLADVHDYVDDLIPEAIAEARKRLAELNCGDLPDTIAEAGK